MKSEMKSEMKDTILLEHFQKQIYEIAKCYGSNTDERYQLLTAHDHIADAIQLISYKFLGGSFPTKNCSQCGDPHSEKGTTCGECQ